MEVDYKFGTMIEIPRAALTADQIAEDADFFSFGTNDLTQTTFGISRDDAEAGFLIEYMESGLLPDNPFATIDDDGVGLLMAWPLKRPCRQTRFGVRYLRRTRRRSGINPALPRVGAELRLLFALQGAHRPPGRGPCGPQAKGG